MPVQVTGLTANVVAVAGSDHDSCAATTTGVLCWGLNSDDQIGNNTTVNSLVPVAVSGIGTGVSALSSQTANTCAIVNGGAMCWGDNARGQLGNNSTTASAVPVAVTSLTTGVQSIAVGDAFACAVTSAGAAVCWGDNAFGQLGNNSTTASSVPVAVASALTSGVQAIGAGGFHMCAIVNDGLQCWGFDVAGELGNNSTTEAHTPVAVTGLTTGVQP